MPSNNACHSRPNCQDQKPFFSVVIATHNRCPFLKIALDSVITQSDPDFELIVVDDGSTDATQTLLASYNDQRLRIISQTHTGVSAARNRGIEAARGSFICFLDSDDRFRKEKLERTKGAIDHNPDAMVFHTEEVWYRNGALLPQKIYHKKPHGDVFETAVKLCCISPSTVAIHKAVFTDVGLFDESLPACEDYDLWLRITARYPVKLIPEYLTIKQGGHADQQSKKYPAMDQFRIYALQKIIEKGTLNEQQRKAALHQLQKKIHIYITGARKRGKNTQVAHYQNILARYSKSNQDG